MAAGTEHNEYVSYPMFKGAVGGAILGFIIAYCIFGFVVGLIVLAVSLCTGAGLIFFKQKKGLHTKKEDHGVFIYACSRRM